MNIDLSNEENDEIIDRSMTNEAERAIEQIKFGVDTAYVSQELERSDSVAYLNIRTLEKAEWCIELTVTGYLIVAVKFDSIDSELKNKNIESFNKTESIDALMLQISPMYIKKFNTSVSEKLNGLITA